MIKTFFHIDRKGSLLNQKIISCSTDYKTHDSNIIDFINLNYPGGITEHGRRYLLNIVNVNPNVLSENNILGKISDIKNHLQFVNNYNIETIFELVRQKSFPSMPSRFQSFFAVDYNYLTKLLNLDSFRNKNNLIFEVASKKYEKLDMSWLKGNRFIEIYYFAYKYWNKESSEDPLYEYVLTPPIKVINKVQIDRT